MLRVAVAKLHTPDGEKLILQRRKKEGTPLFPGGLGFFGGHIEAGEAPHQTIVRELGEETLGLDKVRLSAVASMTVLPAGTDSDEAVEVHVFEGTVEDLGFEATEGAGVELFTHQEALAQRDLIPTTRHILENWEDINGSKHN